VLSSAKMGTASWRYYTARVACRAREYYLGVGEAPGRWHGRGLEELGLAAGAVVNERELEALFARGLHPTAGTRLGRAWRSDGVTGFDLTFSTPKSVISLWALGDGATAAEAMAAHRAAVRTALGYLDGHAALSRRGTDGVEQVGSAGLVAAVFDHRTSRAGDPQLHTHALVLNKVRCEDGRWRTLDATQLFHQSFKIAPGVRMTVSPRGVSTSVGVKGVRVTRGADGRVTRILSAPGTGISHTKTLRPAPGRSPVGAPPVADIGKRRGMSAHADERMTPMPHE
jgi:hypothetical protein